MLTNKSRARVVHTGDMGAASFPLTPPYISACLADAGLPRRWSSGVCSSQFRSTPPKRPVCVSCDLDKASRVGRSPLYSSSTVGTALLLHCTVCMQLHQEGSYTVRTYCVVISTSSTFGITGTLCITAAVQSTCTVSMFRELLYASHSFVAIELYTVYTYIADKRTQIYKDGFLSRGRNGKGTEHGCKETRTIRSGTHMSSARALARGILGASHAATSPKHALF